MNPGTVLYHYLSSSVSSVQSLSRVRLFATPWIAARQASLSITNYQSSPKPMFIESVMPSSHLILCREEELKSLLMKVKEESEKVGLKLNFSS